MKFTIFTRGEKRWYTLASATRTQHKAVLMSLGIVLVSVFVACGTNTSTHSNPPTQSSGPVVISTDHTNYLPGDVVQVTITNNTANTVYALDTQASCSILSLEINPGQNWQQASVAHCYLGRPAMFVQIAA